MASLYEDLAAVEETEGNVGTTATKQAKQEKTEEVQEGNDDAPLSEEAKDQENGNTEEAKRSEEEEEAAAAAAAAIPQVFVGGLAWSTTEAGLRMYFETFGEVKHVDFKRGYAFVHFATSEAADACCKSGEHHLIDGRHVEVKISEPHLASKSANLHSNKNVVGYQQQQQQSPFENSASVDDPSSTEGMTQAQIDERDAPGLNVGRKVFVGGLSQDVREEDLRQLMQHHGNIQDVVVMFDKYTKRSRGFGFVTFVTRAEAEAASKQRRQTLGGKQCEVKLYEPGAKGNFYHQRAALMGSGGPTHQQFNAATGGMPAAGYQHHYNNDWNQHRPFNNNFRGGRGGHQPFYGNHAQYGAGPRGQYDYSQSQQQPWAGPTGGYDYSQQHQPRGWYGGQQQQQPYGGRGGTAGGYYPPRGAGPTGGTGGSTQGGGVPGSDSRQYRS